MFTQSISSYLHLNGLETLVPDEFRFPLIDNDPFIFLCSIFFWVEQWGRNGFRSWLFDIKVQNRARHKFPRRSNWRNYKSKCDHLPISTDGNIWCYWNLWYDIKYWNVMEQPVCQTCPSKPWFRVEKYFKIPSWSRPTLESKITPH